jgi:hypothetical protein
LNGIRLIFAGMPLRRRTSSRASASESLTPFSITYSKVMRRAFDTPGYVRQACSRSLIGCLRLSGTSLSRRSSRTAWSEIASMVFASAPRRSICGTTPEVETVMRRRDSDRPSGSLITPTASTTLSRL